VSRDPDGRHAVAPPSGHRDAARHGRARSNDIALASIPHPGLAKSPATADDDRRIEVVRAGVANGWL
jgi:hypothetical protein